MKTWVMQRQGMCGVTLPGENIIEAIESGFSSIAREAGIGNDAGYKLLAVSSKYSTAILGGAGGVEITILAEGQPLVSGKTGVPETKAVWVYARLEDHPTGVYNFEIK